MSLFKLLMLMLLSCLFLYALEADSTSGVDPGMEGWDYSRKHGPAHWSELSAKFKLCREGHHQSPIDINSKDTKKISLLKRNYGFSGVDVIDNGHTVEFDYESGSYITFNGKKYRLHSFHFHSPSEHEVDGKRFPIEIHLVHSYGRDLYLIVAIFVEEGEENIFVQSLWNHLPMEKGKHFKYNYERINIEGLLPSRDDAYHYMGSLTVPPCTETVQWIIFEKPIEMSKKQINYFHKFYNWNIRPLQLQSFKSGLKES